MSMMDLANLVIDQVQEVVSDILELDETNNSLKDTLKPLPFIEVDHIKNSSNKFVFSKYKIARKTKVTVNTAKSLRRRKRRQGKMLQEEAASSVMFVHTQPIIIRI